MNIPTLAIGIEGESVYCAICVHDYLFHCLVSVDSKCILAISKQECEFISLFTIEAVCSSMNCQISHLIVWCSNGSI